MIKRVFQISLFLIIAGCAIGQQNNSFQDKNILEIYQSLPSGLFENDGFEFKYELQQKDGKWICQSSAGYEIPAVMDLKNGFIEISDEGTGGGSSFVQVVLFRKMDKTPCVGITLGGFNGMFFESSSRFFEIRQNSWTDITQTVFPVIELADFLNPKYVGLNLDKKSKVYKMISHHVRLPQVELDVKLTINEEKIRMLVGENVNIETGEPLKVNETETLIELIGNLEYETILVRWDKQTGKFKLQEKQAISTSKIEELMKVHPVTVSPEEEVMLDMLWSYKEVLDLARKIDSISDHTRQLKLLLDCGPEENDGLYYIRAAEDNGGNWVTYIHFFINPKTNEVFVYDPVNDKKLRLEEWQKSKK